MVTSRILGKRGRAEEALKETEEQLRLIVDALPVLVSYVDSELRFRFVNKRYEEFFGISSGSILGKHVLRLLAGGLIGRWKNTPWKR